MSPVSLPTPGEEDRCKNCARLMGWTHMTHDVPGCECAECVSMCWGDPWTCEEVRAGRLERLVVERDAALAEVERLRTLLAMASGEGLPAEAST